MNTFPTSKHTHKHLLSVLRRLNIQLSKSRGCCTTKVCLSPPTAPSQKLPAPGSHTWGGQARGGHQGAVREHGSSSTCEYPPRQSRSLQKAAGPSPTGLQLPDSQLLLCTVSQKKTSWGVRQIQDQTAVYHFHFDCQFRQIPSGL